MNATDTCTKCSVKVPADAPLGLCPRCLMNAATSATATEQPTEPPNRPAPSIDRAELLRVLRELNLLPADELNRLAATPDAGASPLAQSLVRDKKLTPYQAGALLSGKARGLVIGSYLVEDKLGSGGMGLVLKARHRPSDRVVALKMLPPSFGRDADTVRRFHREFQIASRLNHPNIVAAIEASEDRGIHYLTMEYIPGYDLDCLVSRGGPMALKLALHCVIQVARGLEAAHAQGVIHRDIKPGNIMIDPNGAVRVLDLGLARVIQATTGFSGQNSTLTQTGSYMGTVDFLAPEQADNAKTADARADIYSLACTLYFLLTANPPFSGDTVLKRLMAHQDRPAPSLRAARPEVPQVLEVIYLKMMSKRPGDRPQSMSEVVIALEACRTSAREAGDASADLKTFARTIMKRAPERKVRGADATVFARPRNEPAGLGIGSDLNLEDLVGDYRPEGGHNPLPEDKLPPIVSRPLPHHPRRRRHSNTPYVVFGVGLLVVAGAAFALRPRSAPQVTPKAIISSLSNNAELDPPSPVAPMAVNASAPAPKAPEQGRVLLSEDFQVPNTAWITSTPDEIAKNPGNAHGIADGVWYATSTGFDEWAWDVPGGHYPEIEFEAAIRVLGNQEADPKGGAVIHVLADLPGEQVDKNDRDFKKLRGFQVRVNGAGQLVLEPSFFTSKVYPNGPWRTISHSALKPGGQTNVLKLRITKRRLEIFANGEKVAEPIAFDWDLTPALLEFGVDSWSGVVRAEFDRVEIRELAPPPAEFRSLFNGKDFTGWIVPPDSKLYTVENGEIVIKPGDASQGSKFLVADRPYADFVLKAKTKLVNGNSGIQFRSKIAADGTVTGPQVDIVDNGWGMLYEQGGRGVLGPYDQNKANRALMQGDWNELEIIAQGNHVVVKLNGIILVDHNDPQLPRSGILALQPGYRTGMETRFKDIAIQELAATEPESAPASEPKRGRILFTEDFSNPESGSAQTDPAVLAQGIPEDAHGYDKGVWYCMARDGSHYSWTTGVSEMLPEFEMDVSARVLGDATRSRGSAVIHFFTNDTVITGKKARAFQIRVDGFGRLFVEPSFWSADRYPRGPWKGPVAHPAIARGGGDFNKWTIRVRKRRLEILINGVAVCAPMDFDWDLTPSGINLGVDSEDGVVRAEFDRMEFRELPPLPPVDPKPSGDILKAALDRRIDLNFRNAPLADVIKFVQAATVRPDLPKGVPFFLDPVGLQKAKASFQSPVNISARAIPLKDGLRDILKPLRLGYIVRDGKVVISSR